MAAIKSAFRVGLTNMIASFVVIVHAFSQNVKNYPAIHYNINDGLSNNRVISILKSKNGFLWIGTGDNLNRFDGTVFRQFEVQQQDPYKSQEYNYLCEDNSGNIWFTINSEKVGYIELNQKGYGEIKTISMDIKLRINSMVFKPDINQLLIAFASGEIGKINCNIKRFFLINKSIRNTPRINSLVRDSANRIYYYGLHERGRMEKEKFVNRFKHSHSLRANHSGHYIYSYFRLPLLYRYNTRTYDFDTLNTRKSMDSYLHNVTINYVYGLSDDDILIITERGVFQYNIPSDKFDAVQLIYRSSMAIYNSPSFTIEKDSNNLWIGTNRGLIKIQVNNINFHPHFISDIPEGINVKVRSMYTINNDSVILGFNNMGVRLYSLSSNNLQMLQHYTTANSSLSDNTINTIEHIDGDNYFLGTNSFLHVYNLKLGLLKKFDVQAAWCSYKHNDSIFYFGTKSFGLHQLNINTGAIQLFYPQNAERSNESNSIWYIENIDNMLWVGTNDGLYIFDIIKEKFVTLPIQLQALKSKYIWGISCIDSLVAIGAPGSGLFIFNKNLKLLEKIPTETNFIYRTITDNKKRFWSITDRGLLMYDIKNKHCRLFDNSDGIYNIDFSFVGICNKNTNQIYFSGSQGFYNFNPPSANSNIGGLPPIITSIKVNGKEISNYAKNGSSWTFEAEENNVTIEFSKAEFSDHSSTDYVYSMSSGIDDWLSIKGKGLLSFPKLSSANYTFKVAAINTGNAISTIYINVKKPFWLQWPILILMALLFLLLLYSLYAWRMRVVRNNESNNAQVAAAEIMALESQLESLRAKMNPHFIFNSLNSIQSFIVANQKELANDYLTRFAMLIRHILNYSSQASISLADEISFIRNYLDLEVIRFGDRLTYDIIVEDTSFEISLISIPTMMVQPLLENAIVHGLSHKPKGGHIDIRFQVKEQFVVCTVKDNGVGRAMSQKLRKAKHDSQGLEILYKRLVAFNKKYKMNGSLFFIDLMDNHNESAGTEAKLNLPIIDK